MTIRTGIVLLLLGAIIAPAAAFETVAKAHEVRLGDFRAPATENASVGFKPCRECDSMTVRVTGATRYLVNGRSIGLQKFRLAIGSVTRDRANVPLTVLHHLESNTVISVSVTIRSRRDDD